MSNMAEKYNTLDLCALMKKKSKVVSSGEALKDVKPVEWGKEVTDRKRKVLVSKEKRKCRARVVQCIDSIHTNFG